MILLTNKTEVAFVVTDHGELSSVAWAMPYGEVLELVTSPRCHVLSALSPESECDRFAAQPVARNVKLSLNSDEKYA